jgi:hypothetical protein
MKLTFFDPKPDPQGKTTPTLSNVFSEATKSMGQNMRVACPAIVVKYFKDDQKVDVRLCFKKKYKTDTVVQGPMIYSVPVAFPRSGSAIIAMPLKKDDYVMLVFQDRSIEKWVTDGGEVDPADKRMHDISDAVAYPGLYPYSKKKKIANDTDIILMNESDGSKLEIRVKPNGKIQILNKENELISLIDDLMTAVREAYVYTSTGPQHLRHHLFAQIQSKIKTFVSK